MTRMRILVTVGTVGVLGLVLTGCGSSGKQSFVAQVNAVCASANKQAPAALTGAATTNRQAILKEMATYETIGANELKQLQAVQAPAGKQIAYAQMVSNVKWLFADLGKSAVDLKAGNATAYQTVAQNFDTVEQSLRSEATGLGLTKCASSRAT
ncbi:MAG: hypothetical protein ABSG64_10570 [Solirubrobacteraceae bacterium]|jgi:hypothetical protein